MLEWHRAEERASARMRKNLNRTRLTAQLSWPGAQVGDFIYLALGRRTQKFTTLNGRAQHFKENFQLPAPARPVSRPLLALNHLAAPPNCDANQSSAIDFVAAAE